MHKFPVKRHNNPCTDIGKCLSFAENINKEIMGKLWLTVVCCWLASCALGATDFVWKTGSTMNVACASGEEPVVQVALDLLKRDCEAVLSQPFSVMETEGDIYIGTQGKSTLLEKWQKEKG